MEQRRFRLADWRWILLPVVLVVLTFQAGGTTASAQAARFPTFTPLTGVVPRGVAVDKVGNVYVSGSQGSGPTEHILIWKFAPDGEPLFNVPVDIGQGTIGGLMVKANGDLYIAVAAGTDRGVYRMDRDGQIELLPGSSQIYYANGLVFDDAGTLYITESVSIASMGPPPVPGQGGIWRIRRGESAELCLRDALLTGTGALGQPVPIGANGIAYFQGDLYVTNTEKGTVLRIPVSPDGTVGSPELWKTLQEVPESLPPLQAKFPVVMGDGIALDVHGNLYVAVLTRSAVVRIDVWDKTQETVAAFRVSGSLPLHAKLDFPASLCFGTGKGERTNLFVTDLGMGAWVGPGLVKIDAGVPGQPLQ